MNKFFEGGASGKPLEDWEQKLDYGLAPLPWSIHHDGIRDSMGRLLFKPMLTSITRGYVSANYTNELHLVNSVNMTTNNGSDSMSLMQDIVHGWVNKQFPNRTPQSTFLKFFEEMGELVANPQDRMEWADVFILLFDIAALHGMSGHSLASAIKEKIEINSNRIWAENVMGVAKNQKPVSAPVYFNGGPFDGIHEVEPNFNNRLPEVIIKETEEGIRFEYTLEYGVYGDWCYVLRGVIE